MTNSLLLWCIVSDDSRAEHTLLLLLSLCTHVGQPAVSGTAALPSMATDIFSFC